MNWYRNLWTSYKHNNSFDDNGPMDMRFMNPEDLDIVEFITYQVEHKQLSADSVVEEVVKRGMSKDKARIIVYSVVERIRSTKKTHGILEIIFGMALFGVLLFSIINTQTIIINKYTMAMFLFGILLICRGISVIYQARAENFYYF